MTIRELGLLALGVVIGASVTVGSLAWTVADLERVDRITRAIAFRYRGPRVQGEG